MNTNAKPIPSGFTLKTLHLSFFLCVLCFLLFNVSLPAQSLTPVYYNATDFTGTTNNLPVLLKPVQLLEGAGGFVVPITITNYPTNGQFTNALWPAYYQMTIQGIPQSLLLRVPATNVQQDLWTCITTNAISGPNAITWWQAALASFLQPSGIVAGTNIVTSTNAGTVTVSTGPGVLTNPIGTLQAGAVTAGSITDSNVTSAIVYANSSGALNPLTIGSGLSQTGGTLTATGPSLLANPQTWTGTNSFPAIAQTSGFGTTYLTNITNIITGVTTNQLGNMAGQINLTFSGSMSASAKWFDVEFGTPMDTTNYVVVLTVSALGASAFTTTPLTEFFQPTNFLSTGFSVYQATASPTGSWSGKPAQLQWIVQRLQ